MLRLLGLLLLPANNDDPRVCKLGCPIVTDKVTRHEVTRHEVAAGKKLQKT